MYMSIIKHHNIILKSQMFVDKKKNLKCFNLPLVLFRPVKPVEIRLRWPRPRASGCGPATTSSQRFSSTPIFILLREIIWSCPSFKYLTRSGFGVI